MQLFDKYRFTRQKKVISTTHYTQSAGLTYSYSYGVGNSDVYLIKTDANGNESWSLTFDGSSSDWGNSIQQTSDGGYIVAGWTASYGAGNNDVYLIKTGPNP